MIDFGDQAVVVTGAGRGLGRLYALELARRGAAVVVNDLGSTMNGQGNDPDVADSVVKEITAAGGVAVASHHSVAESEDVEGLIELTIDRYGRLDAVVSNAGIFQTAPFEEIEVADWSRMLRVHLDGSFHLGQAAYRVMRKQQHGRFVFIASSAGMFGQPNSAHYAAAKAGIVGLTNVMAVEGEAHGITVNCVLPFGYSRMVTETVGDREAFGGTLPFLDAIDPEWVVPLVVFLASSACHVTHQTFSACAGRYSRVFVGQSRGWTADSGSVPSAEQIETQMAEIAATHPFTVPSSIFDEVAETCAQLRIPL